MITLCHHNNHGRNLVGDTGHVYPLLFQTGGYNMPFPPLFSL